MSGLAYTPLAVLALFGHLALWVALFNRAHATGVSLRGVKILEKLYVGSCGVIPVVWAWQLAVTNTTEVRSGLLLGGFWGLVYLVVCCGVGALTLSRWTWRRATDKPLAVVRVQASTTHRVTAGSQPLMHGALPRLLSFVPGNQSTHLCVNQKSLSLDKLPRGLDGFSITHLSDLHFTGKIAQTYFDHVIDQANELDSDLVAITGDIIEQTSCFAWLPETLGRLTARHGVFFVLGNHDKYLPDVARLRRELGDLGFIDLGQQCRSLTINDEQILLAGNELPWFGPVADVPAALDERDELRILLSHSPDQMAWARRRRFDLMLAGHTHGGQVRLPLIGPIVAPSEFGIKYAGGTFYEEPTLMHVSRGISGKDTIRINCAPELTKLILRAQVSDQPIAVSAAPAAVAQADELVEQAV